MNPWNILGWMLVACVAIPVVISIIAVLTGLWKYFLKKLTRQFKHFATRNIPVQEGQVWEQNGGLFGGNLTISKIHDNGSVSIRSGNVSWGESAKDWKDRVKNRKLVLISHPKKES